MIENYADEHSDFDRMTCMCDHTEVDCFFDPYTDSLHFAYIGGQLVTEMLRDAVIQDFERQYTKACKEEAEEQKLNAALDRYYQKTGVIL
jgi:hypothetical protein